MPVEPLPIPTLAGTHVRLQPLALSDVPALVGAVSEDRTLYRFSTVPTEPDAMRAWVGRALAGHDEGRELPFTIRSPDGKVLGSTRFYDLESWSSQAESPRLDGEPDVCMVGYTWLSASAQGTACNTEAKLLMLAHAFEIWRVHRVGFRIDARNERSRMAVERLGAACEGVRRAERLGADGQVRDSAYYSILAAEWPGVRAQIVARLAVRGSSAGR